jgi:hypothetical protein
MVKVEVLNDFLVEATGELYIQGYQGEVSNSLAARHGIDGTGFMKAVDAPSDPKPVELQPAK